jgi:hypothetical protein
MPKSFLSVCFCWGVLFPIALEAQLDYIFHEEFHTGSPLPEGYTCYRIFAKLSSPEYNLVGVYGNEDNPMYIGSSLDGNYIFNHFFGGIYGQVLNCSFFDQFPEMEYDSFLTIGLAHSNGINCSEQYPPDCTFTPNHPVDSAIEIIPSLGDPSEGLIGFNPDLYCTNCQILMSVDNACQTFGIPPDNRVLIAQITVPTGTLEYAFNIVTNFGFFDLTFYKNCFVENVYQPNSFCTPCKLIYPESIATVLNPNIDLDCSYCLNPEACNYSPLPYFSGTENCLIPSPCDFNCDLQVDIYDLLDLIESFSCTGECGDPDLNQDEIISVLDLIIMIGCLD